MFLQHISLLIDPHAGMDRAELLRATKMVFGGEDEGK